MKCMLSFFVVVLLLGFAVCCQAKAPDAVPQHSLEGSTQMKLAIGNIIVPAIKEIRDLENRSITVTMALDK